MGDRHEHAHSVGADADRRYLWTALALIVGFMAVEVVVGVVAGSLALLADAGHMTSDAVAIGLALFAMRLAARPAWGAYTFGLKRAEILSAMANGVTLLLLTVWFVVEAIDRLVDPPPVDGALVLATAVAGIAVNIAAALVLRRANRASLNIEGSFQHIVTDLYAFIGTAVAGLVVVTTGFARADPIASLFVAALMARAGFALVRDAGRIFLEAAPRGVHPSDIDAAVRAEAGVVDVHDLHVWEVTSGFVALSAHVLVEPDGDCHAVRRAIELRLADRFGITHTTLQADHPADTGLGHHDPAARAGGDGHTDRADPACRDDPACPTSAAEPSRTSTDR